MQDIIRPAEVVRRPAPASYSGMQIPEMSDYLMAEGLNQLKTNLAFSGDGIQMITVTSSVPNEGKSSVAFNLARTMAENGKKILLVDCDLRKSVMAAKYRMEGIDKGFSHYGS